MKDEWHKDLNFSLIYENIKDDNNPNIHHFIGDMYTDGLGVDKDYIKAAEYFQLSADQGNLHAQNNLGNLYYIGEGVDKDYTKAFEYYQLSADQGNKSALNNLDSPFFKGDETAFRVRNLISKSFPRSSSIFFNIARAR